MMTKQYTFKTTRDTEWMEDILDKIPKPQDRSKLIRELLVIGMRTKGLGKVHIDDPTSTNVTHLTKDTQKTDVLQKTDVTHPTKDTQKTDVLPSSPPPMEEIGEDMDINFEEKLNSIKF